MSARDFIAVSRPEAPPVHLSRPAPGIIAALFCGYLCVGLPLPVIPLFIHDKLGFSNLVVGLVIGIQFLATVLTRGYAGRLTDHHGGKRSALQGAAVCALGGVFYVIAAVPGLSPGLSLGIVVVGRLAAGVGESQFVTGCVSWSIASVGPQRAGMSMSWTGIAMFAALAIGAPVGMALYQGYGLQAVMLACIIAPHRRRSHRFPGNSLYVAGRSASAVLSRDRPNLARGSRPDASGRRPLGPHGVRFALLRGA